MRKTILSIAVVAISAWGSQALAWWDAGHMRTALIAWNNLTPAAKAEASRLLKLNPKYAEWKAAVPANTDGTPGDVDRYVFIRASVWADDIKTYSDYKHDDANGPHAADNIGYADKNCHEYWHFKDIPFSTDGSTWPAQNKVDALSQIDAFIAVLPQSAGKSDDIRSYDLTWLLHLVGDVHQPLHTTAYYSMDLTKKWQDKHKPDQGDRGGNEIQVIPANGKPTNLHFYWDGIFGGYTTVNGAIADDGTDKIAKPADAEIKILDPAVWVQESNERALQFAYAAPVAFPGSTPIVLTREYETNARKVAEMQIELGGYRLAGVLNQAFK